MKNVLMVNFKAKCNNINFGRIVMVLIKKSCLVFVLLEYKILEYTVMKWIGCTFISRSTKLLCSPKHTGNDSKLSVIILQYPNSILLANK